jgi:CheY-like chemotaxis protein
VRLTAVGAQRSTDENVLGSAASDNPIDVLFVGDSHRDVDLTTHALTEAIPPERIKAVHDGAEALAFIFCTGDYANRDPRQQPKLILLDLQLPKVDGREVLRRIRADPLTEDIPVVISTRPYRRVVDKRTHVR